MLQEGHTSSASQPGGETRVAAAPRVTLRFRSDGGREYLYDDVTGSILPWSDLRESVLQAQLAGTEEQDLPRLTSLFGEEDVRATVSYVRHWRDAYHAFVRRATPMSPCPPGSQMVEGIRNASTQLILVVTEQCNLRCRYCVYSGQYQFERTHGSRGMTPEFARRAVESYAQFVAPQLRRYPAKQFGLTFFGGEPLLNMPAVTAALEVAAQKYPGMFRGALTTNGTLLGPENTAVLAKYGVNVALSLDGPEEDHDRRRVDAAGRGSHARILANLAHIRDTYPEFWRDHMSAICVYDYTTDLDRVARFFDENERHAVPPPIFINTASQKDSTYWDAAAPTDYQRLNAVLRRFRDTYKEAQITGRPIGTFSRLLGGTEVMMVLMRQRVHNGRPPALPFTGACFPGHKIAVRVDGTIDLCERVNGTRPLGQVNGRGIELDEQAVAALVADYQKAVVSKCPGCPATRLCGVCYAFALGDREFAQPTAMCTSSVARACQSLRDYVSILEANPRADFSFETDTVRLEKRFQFFS